jgi:hypothetical protein
MKAISCLLVLGAFGWAAPASAGNLDEAKAAFAAGKTAYEQGQFEQALAQFQRANLIQPAPSLSFNIGKTYEHLGRYREAVSAFEGYLQQAGAPQTPDETKFQQDLRVRIAALRTRPDSTGAPQQPPQPQQPQEMQPPQTQNPQYNPYYYYPQQQPYGAQPYYYQQPYGQPIVMTPQMKIADAKRRRATGIGVTVAGIIIEVIGWGLTAVWANTNDLGVAIATGTFGVLFDIAGICMIIPGAVVWGKADADLRAASAQPPPPPAMPPQPQAGYQPTTFLFHAPAIRF